MARVHEHHSTSEPPSAALYDYFRAAVDSQGGDPRNPIAVDTAHATRLLSTVERATARITLRPPVAGVGLPHEAAARLRVLEARGVLPHLSGHAIAQTLQSALHYAHPNALRYAARGWATLEELDRLDLAEVWLSTPCLGNPRRWLRVRLSDRMDELRLWEREKANVHNC